MADVNQSLTMAFDMVVIAGIVPVARHAPRWNGRGAEARLAGAVFLARRDLSAPRQGRGKQGDRS